MYSQAFKEEYQAVVEAYTEKFGEEPGRMFLRGMTAEEALELMKQCIEDNEPLEQFYIDNDLLT